MVVNIIDIEIEIDSPLQDLLPFALLHAYHARLIG